MNHRYSACFTEDL